MNAHACAQDGRYAILRFGGFEENGKPLKIGYFARILQTFVDIVQALEFDIGASLVPSGSFVLEEDDIVDSVLDDFGKVSSDVVFGGFHDELGYENGSLVFGLFLLLDFQFRLGS